MYKYHIYNIQQVTIRGDRAHDILERGLKVKEMELKKKNYSESGIIYNLYIQEISDSEFRNTLIQEKNMILIPVFSEWTSTSILNDPDKESQEEKDVIKKSDHHKYNFVCYFPS